MRVGLSGVGQFGHSIERDPIGQQSIEFGRVGSGNDGELAGRGPGQVHATDHPVLEGAHPVPERDLPAIHLAHQSDLDGLQVGLGGAHRLEQRVELVTGELCDPIGREGFHLGSNLPRG